MSIDYGKVLADFARLTPQGPVPDRLEVGSEVLEALRRTVPPAELPLDPIRSITGVPVIEMPDMPPCAWRLYDTEGNLMRSSSDQPDLCRVYWGHSGCDLPRGHDADQPNRTHRQLEPSHHEVTAETAYLYGEDLTEVERARLAEVWH